MGAQRTHTRELNAQRNLPAGHGFEFSESIETMRVLNGLMRTD